MNGTAVLPMTKSSLARQTMPGRSSSVAVVMIIRFDATIRGEHAHVRVWAGPDREHLALCGRLCFRMQEWASLRQLLLRGEYVVSYPDGLEELIELAE
jgi:hypothetical protein